jgi:hypothetical protein
MSNDLAHWQGFPRQTSADQIRRAQDLIGEAVMIFDQLREELRADPGWRLSTASMHARNALHVLVEFGILREPS